MSRGERGRGVTLGLYWGARGWFSICPGGLLSYVGMNGFLGPFQMASL